MSVQCWTAYKCLGCMIWGRQVAGSPSQIFQYNVELHINGLLKVPDLGLPGSGSLSQIFDCRVAEKNI